MSSQLYTVRYSLKLRLEIGASMILPFALLWMARRSGLVSIPAKFLLVGAGLGFVLGLTFPRTFSRWQRLVSGAQKWIGHKLMTLILALVFALTIIPIGLWLRFRGKSFLEEPAADSYWKPATRKRSLREQY